MAIFYTTGTLNPSSTTLAQDIRVAIKTAITAAITAGKTQWAIVDDGYTVAANIRTVITNTAGFAVKINHSTTLTSLPLLFTFGQAYTVATHTLTNIGFGNATATPAATTFSGVNSVNVDTQPTPHNASSISAVNTQTAWSASIENDYMIFSIKTSSTTGLWVYIGKFQTLIANPALGTDIYTYGMFGSVAPILLNAFGNASTAGNHGPVLGASSAYATPPAQASSLDRYSINPAYAKVAEWYIYRQSSSPTTTAYTLGWLRGKLYDIIQAPVTSATIGNTVSIGTKTYQWVGGTAWVAVN